MTDMTAFLLLRFQVTVGEIVRTHEQVRENTGGGPQYVVQRGVELECLEARRRELGMLLRVAHGMNPNGPWPQPVDKCIMCGRGVEDNTDWLCHTFTCRNNYPAKYEETPND